MRETNKNMMMLLLAQLLNKISRMQEHSNAFLPPWHKAGEEQAAKH